TAPRLRSSRGQSDHRGHARDEREALMRIYSKSPAGAAQAPGIVVIMHGPGLDKFIEDRVDDLARHGYAAAAPDLYHRQPEDGADMMTRIGRLRDTEILADADATIAHLRALKDTRVTDLAVLGFCMGGRITYLLAGARPAAWRAAGVFYGGNIMKPWGEGPAPFDLTKAIAATAAAARAQPRSRRGGWRRKSDASARTGWRWPRTPPSARW